jgi:hypothetical protein
MRLIHPVIDHPAIGWLHGLYKTVISFAFETERYNRLQMEANLTNKLSKLQKFILLEAAKSLPKLEEDARGLNAWRAPFIKPGTKPIEACDLSHITRTKILTKYFGFTMRKHRMWTFCGSFETDYDTGQIVGDQDAYNLRYRCRRRFHHGIGTVRTMLVP